MKETDEKMLIWWIITTIYAELPITTATPLTIQNIHCKCHLQGKKRYILGRRGTNTSIEKYTLTLSCILTKLLCCDSDLVVLATNHHHSQNLHGTLGTVSSARHAIKIQTVAPRLAKTVTPSWTVIVQQLYCTHVYKTTLSFSHLFVNTDLFPIFKFWSYPERLFVL